MATLDGAEPPPQPEDEAIADLLFDTDTDEEQKAKAEEKQEEVEVQDKPVDEIEMYGDLVDGMNTYTAEIAERERSENRLYVWVDDLDNRLILIDRLFWLEAQQFVHGGTAEGLWNKSFQPHTAIGQDAKKSLSMLNEIHKFVNDQPWIATKEARHKRFKELFGGPDQDEGKLEKYVKHIVEFRHLLQTNKLHTGSNVDGVRDVGPRYGKFKGFNNVKEWAKNVNSQQQLKIYQKGPQPQAAIVPVTKKSLGAMKSVFKAFFTGNPPRSYQDWIDLKSKPAKIEELLQKELFPAIYKTYGNKFRPSTLISSDKGDLRKKFWFPTRPTGDLYPIRWVTDVEPLIKIRPRKDGDKVKEKKAYENQRNNRLRDLRKFILSRIKGSDKAFERYASKRFAGTPSRNIQPRVRIKPPQRIQPNEAADWAIQNLLKWIKMSAPESWHNPEKAVVTMLEQSLYPEWQLRYPTYSPQKNS